MPRQRSRDGEQPKNPVAFVSSTYLDNAQRRAWVLDAIDRAGMVALAMERWSADPRAPVEVCVDRVREADVFVGILAWRYGWIPDGEEKSITELEYDEAVRLELPRLLFLIDQPLDRVNVATEFDTEDPWRKQQLLVEFKARARKEQTAAPFTDETLKTLVLQALFEWKERRAVEAGGSRSLELPAFPRLEQHEQQLADYLQAVEAESSSVTLAGFEARVRVMLRLEDLYVELDLAPIPHEDDGRASEHSKDADTPSREAAELTLPAALRRVIDDERLRGLVLLGHPGSGKTTLFRRLALSLAREGAAALGPDQDELVPVFLPLRKLESSDRSLKAFFCRVVGHEDGGFGEGFASWLWERGRLLLLIDGLDEVAKERRGEIKEWIEKVARGRKRNLIAVTCRHEGYTGPARFDADFLPVELRSLSHPRAEDFVRNWYKSVETGLLPPGSAAREIAAAERSALRNAEALLSRVRADQAQTRIWELAHNPMMLTAICLVHRDRKKLPERAAELYKDAVNVLLQHWREAKNLPVSFEAEIARRVLQPVALWLHEEEGRTQATEEELRRVLAPAMQDAGWRELTPSAFLATVRDESGLLTGWSAERYGFLHLAFQEYLAACELYRRLCQAAGDAARFRSEIDAMAARFGPSWWREVLCLVFAIDDKVLFTPLFRALLRRDDLPEHAELARRCIAGSLCFDAAPFRELLRLPHGEGLWTNREVAAELLVSHAKDQVTQEDVKPALELLDHSPDDVASLGDQLAALRIVSRIAAEELAERADALATHPRTEVRRFASMLMQPLGFDPSLFGVASAGATAVGRLRGVLVDERSGCELVQIPGGRFRMGSPASEEGRWDDEGPQHEVTLEPFYLALHPVTNEQYARFLAEKPDVKPPEYWGDRNYNQPRQPVVGVSWDDAKKFCEWAGLVLPTEAQWEYACRAGTTTHYWSGDSEADLARVGWYQTNSDGRLHSVGEKPANPLGLHDMHGNVWEWCEDDWSDDYSKSQRSHPGAYKQKGAGSRVLRGGSFRSSARDARSAFRRRWLPGLRLVDLGFRPAKGITTG